MSAQDSLEYVKSFWTLIRLPDKDPLDDATMHHSNESLLVVDAKALYDAAQRDGMTGFTDKRTGIEILSLRERLKASHTTLRMGFKRAAVRRRFDETLSTTGVGGPSPQGSVEIGPRPRICSSKEEDSTTAGR